MRIPDPYIELSRAISWNFFKFSWNLLYPSYQNVPRQLLGFNHTGNAAVDRFSTEQQIFETFLKFAGEYLQLRRILVKLRVWAWNFI